MQKTVSPSKTSAVSQDCLLDTSKKSSSRKIYLRRSYFTCNKKKQKTVNIYIQYFLYICHLFVLI